MNKETQKKFEKIFLVLSIFPYIMFFVFGLINSIINRKLSIDYFFEPIRDFWETAIYLPQINILYLLLIIFCVAYPVSFFMKRNNEKGIHRKKVSISRILLYLSFIPYVYLIYVAIFGCTISVLGSTTETVYGLNAVLWVLLVFSLGIPIYPLVLLYEIVYFLVNHKKANKDNLLEKNE